MKLSELKAIIPALETLKFQTPDGRFIPSHYHVTEVGKIQKNFIDCGGTIRKEEVINFQLWYADDTDHSLKPERLLKIIELSETKLGLPDVEIEVEYQADTIGKYGLAFEHGVFQLTTKRTDCLANDACGISPEKPTFNLANLVSTGGCTPGGGCC